MPPLEITCHCYVLNDDTFACVERPGAALKVSGYGLTSSVPGRASERLLHATMTLTNVNKCKKAYSNFTITNSMLCSGDGDGHVDSCMGDSGGTAAAINPTTEKWELVGLTSCAQHGSSTVLTRVSKFTDWIRESIQRGRVHPPSPCQQQPGR